MGQGLGQGQGQGQGQGSGYPKCSNPRWWTSCALPAIELATSHSRMCAEGEWERGGERGCVLVRGGLVFTTL